MTQTIPTPLRPALDDLARQLRTRFCARLSDVRLFGSQARGDANDDSDTDVLILVDELTRTEWGEAVDIATGVLLETGVPIQALVMSTQRFAELRAHERLLAQDIDRDGISV